MILDLVLNFHAWSTARPEFETAHAGDTLMDEAQRVLATEREQGMSLFSFGMNCHRRPPSSSFCGLCLYLTVSPYQRIFDTFPTHLTHLARIYSPMSSPFFPSLVEQNRLRLLEFIQRIKTALASLTGFLI